MQNEVVKSETAIPVPRVLATTVDKNHRNRSLLRGIKADVCQLVGIDAVSSLKKVNCWTVIVFSYEKVFINKRVAKFVKTLLSPSPRLPT